MVSVVVVVTPSANFFLKQGSISGIPAPVPALHKYHHHHHHHHHRTKHKAIPNEMSFFCKKVLVAKGCSCRPPPPSPPPCWCHAVPALGPVPPAVHGPRLAWRRGCGTEGHPPCSGPRHARSQTQPYSGSWGCKSRRGGGGGKGRRGNMCVFVWCSCTNTSESAGRNGNSSNGSRRQRDAARTTHKGVTRQQADSDTPRLCGVRQTQVCPHAGSWRVPSRTWRTGGGRRTRPGCATGPWPT